MPRPRQLLYTFYLFMLTGTLLLAQQPKKSVAVHKLEKQRTELLNAIKKTDKEIKVLGQSLPEKNRQDKLIRQQIKDRSQVISLSDQEVSLPNVSISSLARQIGVLQQEGKVSRGRHAQILRAFQQCPRFENRLLFILFASSFDEGIRRVCYLSAYAKAHREVVTQLHDTCERFQASQSQLIVAKQQKGTLLQLRIEERVKLEQQQKNIVSKVKELSPERQSFQKKLKQQQRKAEQLNQAIQDQTARETVEAECKTCEECERLERETHNKGQKVPKQAERRAETKDGYTMDAIERKLASSFAANKGRLPAPVKERYRVIRHFGFQQHDDLALVQTRNGGIGIQASRGTQAVAIFDGVVSKVFVVPGYNNSIIICHGNYLTVYVNLRNVLVRAGQKVKTGQVLGTVASDDEGQYGVMQLQAWHERTKLNPQARIR